MKSLRAGAIVINSKNQIALANEHLWGFPRGGVEDGEDFINTAIREVNEEIGLTEIKLVKELGIYERYPQGITAEMPGAYPMEIHMFLFRTNYLGDLHPQDEDIKYTGWFTYEEALERITNDKDREFLKSIRMLIS
jgi:ADP-ribose pyrophosphatase YjhB (NUDIX family)